LGLDPKKKKMGLSGKEVEATASQKGEQMVGKKSQVGVEKKKSTERCARPNQNKKRQRKRKARLAEEETLEKGGTPPNTPKTRGEGKSLGGEIKKDHKTDNQSRQAQSETVKKTERGTNKPPEGKNSGYQGGKNVGVQKKGQVKKTKH